MRLAFFGDIVGKPGRRAVGRILPALRSAEGIDFVVGNAENAAGGVGVDPGSARELFAAGFNVLTSGNHVWAKRQIVEYIADSDVLLRPANFAPGVPGWGYTVKAGPGGESVAVVNLIGRVFMGAYECPFRAADAALAAVRDRARVVVVDMHAEATSEKVAMGWYLDGRASAVVGSHTHVQTADERILPGGTAYVTDVGMCGPMDSVIGVNREQALRRFLTQMPTRFEVADGRVLVQGVIVDVDGASGTAIAIRRIREVVEA
ncbi:MAG: TIGR00282 family metallophosphoesterase [Deltaproteobacteria bacterium]|nr:TIGR00282 family metallophosphoesterase [Deltaproteobacteria bacterium]